MSALDNFAAEADVLRLLLGRLMAAPTATEVARAAGDLDACIALLPVATAVRKIAVGMATAGYRPTSTDVATAITNALVAAPAAAHGLTAQSLMGPCTDPGASSKILVEMRAAYTKRRMLAAITRAEKGASNAQLPLVAMQEALRKELSTFRSYGTTDVRELLTKAVREGEMIQEGTAGFVVDQPYMAAGLASWFCGWMPGRRITPGLKILVGGDSNTGKTSFANAIVASALSSKTPVMYWQAELALHDHASQIQAALTDRARGTFLDKHDPVPEAMSLLRYPPPASDLYSVQTVLDETQAWVDELAAVRSVTNAPNPCPGLLVIDYMQLVDDTSSDSADYRRSELVASKLATIASQTGIALLMLSQVTRTATSRLESEWAKSGEDGAGNPEQRRRQALTAYANNAFAGANIRRVADVAYMLVNMNGERMLVNSKDRSGGADHLQLSQVVPIAFTTSGRVQTSLSPETHHDEHLPSAKRKGKSTAVHDAVPSAQIAEDAKETEDDLVSEMLSPSPVPSPY